VSWLPSRWHGFCFLQVNPERAAKRETTKEAPMTAFTITPGPSASILRGLSICALSLGFACLLTLLQLV